MNKNFIDLFCGAGGLSLGFEKAGYKCVGAIDVSKACINTHKLNFPDCVSINSDISKIKPNKFKEKIGNKKIHLVVGGPPCPTFSTIGHAKIKSVKEKKILISLYLMMIEIFYLKTILITLNTSSLIIS